MRRIDSKTKEAIFWTRAQVVYINERQEAQVLGLASGDQYDASERLKDLISVNVTSVDSMQQALAELFIKEVAAVAVEYDFDPTASGSAFPFDGMDSEETCADWVWELVGHVIDLWHMPAVEIADHFEEWLNELSEYHEKKRS